MLDLRRAIYIFNYYFHYLFNFTFFTRAAFCEFLLYLQFGVIDDVNSLSLGYYPASSPDAPAVLGDVDSAYLSQCRLDSDQSVCCATFRFFKIGDDYNLSDLKKLVVHFGLVWNFVASRAGSSFRCNRYTYPGSSVRKVILRRTSPNACGCEWSIRFRWLVAGMRTGIDYVKIIYISGSHTNTCDPSDTDQLMFNLW